MDVVDDPPTGATGEAQISYPTDYLSVRITIPHDDDYVDRIRRILYDHGEHWCYVIYPHHGSGGDNEHYHLLIVDERISMEGLRNAFKREFVRSGNGFIRMKMMHNGILKGIQYCSKEGTAPLYASGAFDNDHVEEIDRMEMYVRDAPAWVPEQDRQTLLPLDDERPNKKPRISGDWMLTYNNIVNVAVDYARKKGFRGSLKSTVKELIKNTKWQPSKWMLTGGVPEYYENLFDRRTGRVREDDVNMEWWNRSGI